VELSAARGARLRTRSIRRPAAGSRGAAVVRSCRARRPASGVARGPRLGRDSLTARRLREGGGERGQLRIRTKATSRFEVAAPRAAGATRDCQFRHRRYRTAPRIVGLQRSRCWRWCYTSNAKGSPRDKRCRRPGAERERAGRRSTDQRNCRSRHHGHRKPEAVARIACRPVSGVFSREDWSWP
jgi:hypothetical protein